MGLQYKCSMDTVWIVYAEYMTVKTVAEVSGAQARDAVFAVQGITT